MTFYFNGIDGSTGEYLMPPLCASQLARRARDWLSSGFPSIRTRGEPIHGVDPKDLATSGWGIVFAEDAGHEPGQALRELLDHRRRQAARVDSGLYQEYSGSDGYRPGETAHQWLTRHGAGPGAADPEGVPYYLLLVGGPREMPFEFQFDLGVQHAVGRLSFDNTREYGHYARHVVSTEMEPPVRRRQMALWAVDHPDDAATDYTTRFLVRPLIERLRRQNSGWQLEERLGPEATKAELSRLLGGLETPALLFTASHGMGFSDKNPGSLNRLGALLCQDWPGPKVWKRRIPRRFFFSAEDIDQFGDLSGLICFHFACFSAGVPRIDSYARQDTGEVKVLAPEPTLARLPQRLLGKAAGGALAVIGHVDRARGTSFVWPGAGAQPQTFAATVGRLLDGHPVGSATRFLGDRYADLSVRLHQAAARYHEDDPPSVKALARIWTAYIDARSYVILGDPAVRLAARES